MILHFRISNFLNLFIYRNSRRNKRKNQLRDPKLFEEQIQVLNFENNKKKQFKIADLRKEPII